MNYKTVQITFKVPVIDNEEKMLHNIRLFIHSLAIIIELVFGSKTLDFDIKD